MNDLKHNRITNVDRIVYFKDINKIYIEKHHDMIQMIDNELFKININGLTPLDTNIIDNPDYLSLYHERRKIRGIIKVLKYIYKHENVSIFTLIRSFIDYLFTR